MCSKFGYTVCIYAISRLLCICVDMYYWYLLPIKHVIVYFRDILLKYKKTAKVLL